MGTVQPHAGSAIRPFSAEIPEAARDDLRRGLAATRWPSGELVDDRSRPVQLATARAGCRCWATVYELGRAGCAARSWPPVYGRGGPGGGLDALPQCMTAS